MAIRLYKTTTNGTLVHGEIQDWLRARKERFLMSLSLDGTASMHDKNRQFLDGRGSFGEIDLDFFRKTWPECPAKMTISEDTLPGLAEGVKYLESMGFRCDATLSVGVDWDRDKYMPVLARELNKLVDYYTEHPEKKLCTMLDLDFRLVFAPIDKDYRFCGAGIDMVCYDAQGGEYPCQGFAPVSLGEQAEEYRGFDERKFRFSKENPCKSCPWVRLCPNCYAANLQSTGNIQTVDPNLCGFYKLCILASAKIQCRRILAGKEITKDDLLVLKAVEMVQDGIEISL